MTTPVTGSIGILELRAICDEQYAVSLGWFTALGRRVSDTSDPALQRLFATAAHRHAWHAELWAGRRPTIPPVDDRDRPAAADVEMGPDDAAAYRDGLAAMRSTLAALRTRVDPDLDPSTMRVIDLVDRDLAKLAAGLA